MTDLKQQQNNAVKEKGEVSIHAFVENNFRLFTVLSAFMALTIFSNTIDIVFFRNALTTFFLLAAILIFYEIYVKARESASLGSVSWQLVLLEILLFIILIMLAWYYAVMHVMTSSIITFFMLFIILLKTAVRIINIDWSGKYNPRIIVRSNIVRIPCKYILYGLVILSFIYISFLFAKNIYSVLHEWRNNYKILKQLRIQMPTPHVMYLDYNVMRYVIIL